MPFIDAPEPYQMKTAPVPWTPVPLMHARVDEKPQRAFAGEHWRILASSEQTGGTYSLCEVTTKVGFEERTHVTGHDAGIYVLEGTAQITLDGRSHQLREGSFAYIPAGTARQLIASERVRSLRFMLPGGYEGAVEKFDSPSEKPVSQAEKDNRNAAIAAYQAEMGTLIIS